MQSNGNSATVAKLMLLLLDPPNLGTAEVAAELVASGFVTPALALDCQFAEFLHIWFVSDARESIAPSKEISGSLTQASASSLAFARNYQTSYLLPYNCKMLNTLF
jgi:hypothetical protein